MRPALPLLFALLVLPGLAAADHTYSHRYVVLVRVEGPDGAPVSGADVAARYGMANEGPCTQRGTVFGPELPLGTARTGADGLAALCAHAHGFLPGATVEVDAAGQSAKGAADSALRLTVARAVADAPAGPPSHVLLHARLWRAGPGTLDGVPVEGTALPFLRVEATLRFAGGAEVVGNGTTDSYGDVLIRVPVPSGAAASGNATLRAGEINGTIPFARGFGSGSVPDPSPTPSRLALDPAPSAPTPLPALLALGALALGGLRRAR